MIFSIFKKIGFWGIFGPPYCGIGASIRIGREMICLPYAGFIIEFIIDPSIHPFILFLPQLYGATTPKQLEKAL